MLVRLDARQGTSKVLVQWSRSGSSVADNADQCRCRGSDVVVTLERVTRMHRTLRMIRVGSLAEVISKVLNLWVCMSGVTRLPAVQAYQRCLHRVTEGIGPGRMLVRLLVFEPGECSIQVQGRANGCKVVHRTVRSVRKPRSGWPLLRGRHAGLEENEPGFFQTP